MARPLPTRPRSVTRLSLPSPDQPSQRLHVESTRGDRSPPRRRCAAPRALRFSARRINIRYESSCRNPCITSSGYLIAPCGGSSRADPIPLSIRIDRPVAGSLRVTGSGATPAAQMCGDQTAPALTARCRLPDPGHPRRSFRKRLPDKDLKSRRGGERRARNVSRKVPSRPEADHPARRSRTAKISS